MTDATSITLAEHETQPIGPRARQWATRLFAVGGLALIGGLVASLAMGGWTRFGFAYLAGFAFALSIGLGCLLLVLVTHLFRAGWVVVVRRVIECHAAAVSALTVLFIPILLYVFLGGAMLYPWADAAAHHGEGDDHAAVTIHTVARDAHDDPHAPEAAAGRRNLTYGEYGDPAGAKAHDTAHMIELKRPFLNKGVFTLLWVVFFAVWSVLGVWYLHTSMKQDATGDPKLTNQREAAAPLGTLLFAFTTTFAAFTLLMSLDPTWYSTIYGVYYFSGAMIGALATLILVLMALEKAGVLSSVTLDHYHDLGKLLFAFVVFWAYIAYSQYMLIWYGSIPAEQPWPIIRGLSTAHPNGFSSFAVFMLLGHFLVPFCFLLSRHVKRNKVALGVGAAWMLLVHGADVFWLVLPEYQYETLPIPVPEALCMIGATAVLLGAAARFAAPACPVAHGDPRLEDSLRFRNY